MKNALFAIAFAAAAHAECLHQDAASYWMRERTSGVQIVRDAGGRREWQHSGRTHICYTTPLADIADPQWRDAGYRQAVGALLDSLPFEPRAWSTAGTVAVRQKIATLVGRDFESLAALIAWWQENGAFLRWSEEKQQLVIDGAAKAAGPAAPRESELRAADYWKYEAMRKLSDVSDDGTFIRGLAAPGDVNLPAEIRFRVAKSSLADRAAKEEGYKRAVTALIEILALPEITPPTARHTRAQLTRLTGRTFADARGWAGWWNARRAVARLDESATRLIAE